MLLPEIEGRVHVELDESARKEGVSTMRADEIGRGDRSRLARGDRLQNG